MLNFIFYKYRLPYINHLNFYCTWKMFPFMSGRHVPAATPVVVPGFTGPAMFASTAAAFAFGMFTASIVPSGTGDNVRSAFNTGLDELKSYGQSVLDSTSEVVATVADSVAKKALKIKRTIRNKVPLSSNANQVRRSRRSRRPRQ